MATTAISLNPVAPVSTSARSQHEKARKATIALWTVQILLAALFLLAGVSHLITPVAELAKQLPLPIGFVRFIGAAEFAGALGLVLPGLFRIRQYLTPVAAGCLVIIMSGAVGVSLTLGQVGPAALPLVIGILAGTVAYGRRAALATHAS